MQVVVANRKTLAADIVGFELVGRNEAGLPRFEPGAHIDVHVPGCGLIRQYSLWNDPAESFCYRIAVLRDASSRGGSRKLHEGLREGDILQIGEPRNNFGLAPAQEYILFAGGIGVTPLLSMAQYLKRTGRRFALHYFVRSRERAAFLDWIAGSSIAEHVRLHVDEEKQAGTLELADILAPASQDARIYVCGPLGFINWVQTSATDHHWDSGRIHIERFSSGPDSFMNDEAFDVEIAGTGEVFQIPPGRSVADVLAENGFFIPISCGAGICGTCITGVLAGTPEHRDQVLSPDEHARGEVFTPCCSRSRGGRLVLDL